MNNATRKRVLLVARDPSAFPGLRKHLSAKGSQWDAFLVNDAGQALAGLARMPPDAVVVENDVNCTEGDSFLAKARALQPDLALLLVRDGAVPSPGCPATTGVTVVSAACDGEPLLAMIDRAHNLAGVLNNATVRAVVGNIDRLPTVPQTYHALMQAAADPETSIVDIARIIQSDPVMTIKILQLVNSAFFGRAQKTSSITQAVSFLGIELLKSLVLSAHVFGALDATKVPGFSVERFQNYSIRIARLAQRFVVDRKLADEAFTAGIVHDIGKMVFALQQPAKFEQIIEQVMKTGVAEYLLEQEVLGVTHADTGACLLAIWGIPWSIVESVAFHHRPGSVPTAAGNCEVLAAVHAADALTGIVCCGEPEDRLDLAFIERAGLLGELGRWRKLVEDDHVG